MIVCTLINQLINEFNQWYFKWALKELQYVSKYYIQLKYFNLQKIWNCEFHIFRYKISPQDVGPYNLYSCRYLSEFHIYSYKTSPQDVGPYNFYSCKYVTLNLNLYQRTPSIYHYIPSSEIIIIKNYVLNNIYSRLSTPR